MSKSLTTDPQPQASKREVFELLISELKEYRSGIIENAAKVTGFLLLAIGWLATSQAPRSILDSPLLKVLTCASLLVAASMTIRMYVNVYNLSQSAYDQLQRLNYMEPSHYRGRLIDPLLRNVC